MRSMLLPAAAAIAAIAIPAAPAAAQSAAHAGFVAGSGEGGNHDGGGFPDWRDGRGFDRDGRDGRHGRRRGNDIIVGPLAWSEAWALYNNRTFEPDSYNDWWHDRPDRAYPRWMQSNRDCQRMWWSGGGWRC
jgi:hypothetical protein